MTLTVWQNKKGLHPTRAGTECLENPDEAEFDAAIARLLATVGEEATPFQIVAQVGHSSRAFQFGKDPLDGQAGAKLWADYQKARRRQRLTVAS